MAFGDHPNFKNIEAARVAFCKRLDQKQHKHLQTKGEYFQGLLTPAVDCDGVTKRSIGYGLKVDTLGPVESSWSEFDEVYNAAYGALFKMRVDRYDAPNGSGYRGILTVKYAGIGPDNYGIDGDEWLFIYHPVWLPGDAGGTENEWFIYTLPPV